MDIVIKRIYEPSAKTDGTRILVDRLWPRGISKASANIDLWLRDIAPSAQLRTWFNHDPTKWTEFQRRYKAELRTNQAAIKQIASHNGRVTLLYGAKDKVHNHAIVLQRHLDKNR